MQPDVVVQGKRLKNCAQLVIRVRALTQNIEAQIDFRESWDANFGHSCIKACRSWPWISAPRDASIAKASFRVRPLCRFRRPPAGTCAIPSATFPTPKRPNPGGRAWRRHLPSANESWDRGLRARGLCAAWLPRRQADFPCNKSSPNYPDNRRYRDPLSARARLTLALRRGGFQGRQACNRNNSALEHSWDSRPELF